MNNFVEWPRIHNGTRVKLKKESVSNFAKMKFFGCARNDDLKSTIIAIFFKASFDTF